MLSKWSADLGGLIIIRNKETMKYHIYIFLLLALSTSINLSGQAISINTTGEPPHPSAILDVSSTDKGMLIPRLTSFPVNAAEGLLVYREDLKCFYFNDGQEWKIMEGIYQGGNGINIDQNNTISIEVPGQQAGDMMCYDGSNWIRIPKGQDGDILVIKNGAPQWQNAPASNPNPPHYVGESFGGGIVFYVDGTGMHGLIAAPADEAATLSWAPTSTHQLVGANGDAIGAGATNTALIVAAYGPGVYAAQACDDFTGGGFTDWYLPSLFELSLLYNVQNTVGGFSNTFYWSSTEADAGNAQCVFFGNGEVFSDNKSGATNVRAIRAF